jgi:hypothetical protein
MGSPAPRVEERAPTAPRRISARAGVADRIASLHVPNRTPRDKVRPRSGPSPFGPSLVASFWGKWAVSQLILSLEAGPRFRRCPPRRAR